MGSNDGRFLKIGNPAYGRRYLRRPWGKFGCDVHAQGTNTRDRGYYSLLALVDQVFFLSDQHFIFQSVPTPHLYPFLCWPTLNLKPEQVIQLSACVEYFDGNQSEGFF